MVDRLWGNWLIWGIVGLMIILILALAACVVPVEEEKTPIDENLEPPPTNAELLGYAGSDTCFDCHPDKHNDFVISGNPWKLKTSEVARNNPIPVPAGYAWELISYVIGGNKWSTLYVDNNGYIITSAGGEPGNNQYNLMSDTWTDYRADELVPFSCGTCHSTGYSPDGHQGGLEGIVGTWVLEGVQCEACHGPALEHTLGEGAKKETITITSTADLCGQCHISGDDLGIIPAAGGFILKNGQYNEHQASPHRYTDCVKCHDPHKKGEFSIRVECSSCHQRPGDEYSGSTMDIVGVDCEDCHMAKVTKSAQSLGPYQGDVMTHLFRINTDSNASMFSADGSQANSFITLDFACLSCHQQRDIEWASTNAQGIHTAGK